MKPAKAQNPISTPEMGISSWLGWEIAKCGLPLTAVL